jgi:hypothetical protein
MRVLQLIRNASLGRYAGGQYLYVPDLFDFARPR